MGLTLDYETSGFLEEYNPDFNSNAMDYSGRHCFKEQPGVLAWDLVKLAEALKIISDFPENISILKKNYMETFQKEYNVKMREKMGFFKNESEDLTLIKDFLKLLETSKGDYTRGFRFLSSMEFPINVEKTMIEIKGFCSNQIDNENWIKFFDDYEKRIKKEELTIISIQEKMQLVNPRFVIRAKELKEAMDLMLNEEGNMNGVNRIYDEILNAFK